MAVNKIDQLEINSTKYDIDLPPDAEVSIKSVNASSSIKVNGTDVLTAHQSIKTLDTTATSAQSTTSDEAIAGTGKIILHKISKTGNYNDLLKKPAINNGTLTIQKNGSDVQTFTANQSDNVTANIIVPTRTSELNNDTGFLTAHQPIKTLDTTSTTPWGTDENETFIGEGKIYLHKIVKTGDYSDLSNKPTLGSAARKNTGTASGNVPVLDSNGKLADSVIPAVAITDTYEASSQDAMLKLDAQKGDICIRSDLNKSFVLQTTPASTLGNWKELKTPTDAVLSVNKKTGAVQLTASDVDALPSDTKYAASSSVGGVATSAAKLSNTDKIGDTNKPVYFTANGVPAAISYTIEKSVPSNAVFTDTHYTNYLQIKGNGTEAVKFEQNANKTLNLKPGNNVSISAAANEITISATVPTKSSWNYDDAYVKYSEAQNLTDAQKKQARDNISAVSTNKDETISGLKTFAAPINESGTEQATVWFNTANGGRVGFGKEGPNSGTGIFFDQVSGTRRLKFRASATPGAMVWEQPENGSCLYYDVDSVQFRKCNSILFNNFKSAGYLYTDSNGSLKKGTLSKVATSGSYNDLTDKPTLPVGTNGQLLSTNGSSLVWTNDNRGLLHHDLNVEIPNTTTDSGWSMFNSSYNGYLLKSVRFNAQSPDWGVGDFGSGIVFGGVDTKGVMSVSYGNPKIKFAGGNGSGPRWWVGLTGTSGTSYDLDRLKYAPTSAGTSGYSLKSNGSGAPRWANEAEVALSGSLSAGVKNNASITLVITNTSKPLKKGVWRYSGNYGVFLIFATTEITTMGSPKTEYICGYVSSSISNNTSLTLVEV